jgi:hypothetical protein
MKTGALIFARNNEQIDYEAMARWSAKNIERHLEIPTHIITDDSAPATNTRHFTDVGAVTWHNLNRMDAYRLSPWDRTLVLDADYVVASNQLQSILEADQDFLAHRWAYDVTGCNNFEGLNYFGNNRMPMWWATVMMFRKSNHARLIFESMQMIRDNWTHYRNLYKNPNTTYRNDHALSIALGMVNGHTLNHPSIPWNLASLTPDHALTQTAQDCYRVDFVNTENNPRWIELTQDFHAMGKQQLGEIVANPC